MGADGRRRRLAERAPDHVRSHSRSHVRGASAAVVDGQRTYQLWFKPLDGTSNLIQLWGARISYR